ncbi:MAG: 30S ribosomal protein S18 [bacterium]
MAQKKKKKKINKNHITNLSCPLCTEGVKELDYKDLSHLKKFVSRRGKILPRSRTGACAKHQRSISTAVKRSRYVALLPFLNLE